MSRHLLERSYAQLAEVIGRCTEISREAERLSKHASKLALEIDRHLRGDEQLELFDPEGSPNG